METGDAQSNGTTGFASSAYRNSVVGVVINAPEDDGCRTQKGTVVSNHSRPPLKDTTNQIASPVRNGYDSGADDSDSLPSSCGATSPGFVDRGDDDEKDVDDDGDDGEDDNDNDEHDDDDHG